MQLQSDLLNLPMANPFILYKLIRLQWPGTDLLLSNYILHLGLFHLKTTGGRGVSRQKKFNYVGEDRPKSLIMGGGAPKRGEFLDLLTPSFFYRHPFLHNFGSEPRPVPSLNNFFTTPFLLTLLNFPISSLLVLF